MSVPEQFTGYAAHDEAAGKKLEVKPYSYTPQKWEEDLVDIKISHSGVCGSCVHTLHNGWPIETIYPVIAGHEIIGEVVRAGKNSGHKVGDRVGVGAQGSSCLKCEMCKAGLETYCKEGNQATYQGKADDGSVMQGGYADYIRVKGHFSIPIPKELTSETAAPMLCAGVTAYNPVKSGGAAPGKKVGIIGVGGLGHLGLQWSEALGADTYAFSHSPAKEDDVAKLGISRDNFIDTTDQEAVIKKYEDFFDLIVCTSDQKDLPLEKLYLPLLKSMGKFTIVGLPEGRIPAFYAQGLAMKGLTINGSLMGPPAMIKEMLDVAVKHNVRTWAETFPMEQVGQKLKDLDAKKAHFRYVMTN